VVALPLVMWGVRSHMQKPARAIVAAGVDLIVDRVVMELVENSALSLPVKRAAIASHPPNELVFGDMVIPIHVVDGVVPACVPIEIMEEQGQEFGTFELDATKANVELHRVVRPRNRSTYTNLVVAECKMVFGVPKATEANMLAVRRRAVALMKKHGVRPSHISALAPKIVELVFVPSRWELEAKKLGNSAVVYERTSQYWKWSLRQASTWLGRWD